MATTIFDHAHPNMFQPIFNFHKSVLTYKKSDFSSICSGDTLDLKILQSDWPSAFWPISQESGSSMGLVHQYSESYDQIQKKNV